MNHYFEIKVNSRGKKSIPSIINDLMRQSHYAIINVGIGKLALSFPNYGDNLGDTLRFHGSLSDLNLVLESSDLDTENKGRLTISQVKECPVTSIYRCYSRVRPSKQNSKLNAGLKSGHITDSKEYRSKMFSEIIDKPFFQYSSGSTKQSYKFFVGMKESDSIGGNSDFNSYGFSKDQFLPHF